MSKRLGLAARWILYLLLYPILMGLAVVTSEIPQSPRSAPLRVQRALGPSLTPLEAGDLNLVLPGPTRERVRQVIIGTSAWYGADPLLIARLVRVESYGDSLALGPPVTVMVHGVPTRTRAVGLGQIIPELWLGVFPECGNDLHRVRDNICYTINIYQHYQRAHPNDPEAGLLAYNGCQRGWSCDWYAGAILP